MGFEGSYVWKLRQALGNQRLIVAGVAMLVMTPEGKVWLGRRAGSGDWCYFGGAIEVGDSVMDTVTKEIREELGIETRAEDWTYIGLLTEPAFTNYTYPNGDLVQSVNHFFFTIYDGELGVTDDEHTEFGAFDLDDLPSPLKVDVPVGLGIYKAYQASGKVVVR